jgi:hypothetical protein
MVSSTVPVAAVPRIASEDEGRALAHRLLTPGRTRPTVVLTIAGGQSEPFGDPEEIKDAVGDLADVVLMATSAVSWAFSREMPPMTQVYGGAGRVYPVDHGWVNFPGRSRIRFAYSSQDRGRVTEQLINDALHAALAGGLLSRRPSLVERSGSVRGFIGSRALVRLDGGGDATVWEELTVPGVPLDRVLAPKQKVTGTYDPASGRLDVRKGLSSGDLPPHYRVGDVVLAEVAEVTTNVVLLRLLPALIVGVDRQAITSNELDTLPELFTAGEVVTCRIVAAEPLELRLDDLDDEDPQPAPSLLPGGPPWLRLAERAPLDPPADPAPILVAPSPEIGRPADLRPSPVQLDRRRASATDAALSVELTTLRKVAGALEAERDHALRALERAQTGHRNAELARQKLAKQLRSVQSRPIQGLAFTDPVVQFRHEIYCAWADRIPAAEKRDRPLVEFELGPGFLPSVEQVEGVSRAKIVAVVVEILTGQAHQLSGRDCHQLRVGDAGTRYVTRPDGATCWRVALQQDTPAARRLHFWRLRDHYEFSRVVLHDDYRP